MPSEHLLNKYTIIAEIRETRPVMKFAFLPGIDDVNIHDFVWAAPL